ncbi:hypothetical protein EDEG_00979 [Edhazardia aedis USNM 41457]|uniref:Uncharacterized protein n=1 Tax=Edhazardia aedis (strain USNM 41457) TaxID=1003232 RepID=J9DU64_EDHAE|nr:hypothetical protein EDEG_00979 [Edhazardia aedis USNM 41457]|eukprot:EJW04842.1 hypothetical protein EDEG_00979 [Edhazardia aedis USNM 41457]
MLIFCIPMKTDIEKYYENEYMEYIETKPYEVYIITFMLLIVLSVVFGPLYLIASSAPILLINFHGCRSVEKRTILLFNIIYFVSVGISILKYVIALYGYM